jgi:hypothetical protein
MHYPSPVYSVTISLLVSVLPTAHHQKTTMYICDSWYVLYVLVDRQWAWLSHCKTAGRPEMCRDVVTACLVFCEFLFWLKEFRCCTPVWKSFRFGTRCLEFVKAALIVPREGNEEQFNFNYHNQLLIVVVCE